MYWKLLFIIASSELPLQWKCSYTTVVTFWEGIVINIELLPETATYAGVSFLLDE
jgi:hypothetical protein